MSEINNIYFNKHKLQKEKRIAQILLMTLWVSQMIYLIFLNNKTFYTLAPGIFIPLVFSVFVHYRVSYLNRMYFSNTPAITFDYEKIQLYNLKRSPWDRVIDIQICHPKRKFKHAELKITYFENEKLFYVDEVDIYKKYSLHEGSVSIGLKYVDFPLAELNYLINSKRRLNLTINN